MLASPGRNKALAEHPKVNTEDWDHSHPLSDSEGGGQVSRVVILGIGSDCGFSAVAVMRIFHFQIDITLAKKLKCFQ
jgi:hypothetical protein